MIRTLLAVSTAAVLALTVAGCGGGEKAAAGSCEVQVTGDIKAKPTITVPSCDPPKELQTKDVIAGNGDAVKGGESVAVQYVGVSWSTKKQFDASWDRGAKPFPVDPVGQARVIDGWNKGLIGIKPGGRRLLVIPPDLGYGEEGSGPDIKGGETLVFVVDAVSVQPSGR